MAQLLSCVGHGTRGRRAQTMVERAKRNHHIENADDSDV